MKFGRRATHGSLFTAAIASLAIAAPAAIADEAAPPAPTPKMSVAFTKSTASVAGPRALVSVRCNGVVSRECVGTLSLETPSGSERVPYSIAAGEKRTLVVPLLGGESESFLTSARAVTETMQLSGASVRTARVLHIK